MLAAQTAEAISIETTSQRGPCKARLQTKAKRQAVQWIDGPGKTGSDGVGDEDIGVKPHEDEPFGERGTPKLDVQEMELNQPPTSQERNQETQEAPPDPEEGTQEAPLDPEERKQEAPLDPKEETREVP